LVGVVEGLVGLFEDPVDMVVVVGLDVVGLVVVDEEGL